MPMLLALLLLTGLTIVGGYFYLHRRNQQKAKPSGPTPSQIKQASDVDAQNKKNFTESSSTSSDKSGGAPSTSPLPTPTADNITLDVSRNGSNVTIISKLTGVASGQCQLSITNGSQSYSKNAAVIYQPEFSTCAGFDVPVSSLGKGSWLIKLTVTLADGREVNKQANFEII